ncbi:MAG TPA: phosphoribosylamine--glycine ligase [Alphaproteobacteria bacterium]|nr:phosphoribosylamine--glycine ligase [Alphaproteobacteria bacterium]HOO49796.1 phosphoribosylamine--glycine ligase [Alphaproteobacteria bacterium]
MKILLIGSGGREHAMAWKIKQSPLCDELIVAPGNAGIAQIATCVPIPAENIAELVALSQNEKIDFAIVGPEAPLVLGLADELCNLGIPVFGPSAAAAQLEGSKGFMKDLCKKYNIPTASYERFTDLNEALNYINKLGAPIVIKADGLAAGKGVVVAMTLDEAIAATKDMLSGNAFGQAGASIVIEEFMDGEEISYFAICDGENLLPLISAQDHKRVGDGDTGPNTGGMGAYSPARLMTPAMEQEILENILKPTVSAMKAEGCPFTGVFFAGIMVVNDVPKLLEYNVRFGDPECQTLMMRLKSDLVEILYAAAIKKLDTVKADWSENPSLCVVMAAKGYPGSYTKNTPIRNLETAAKIDGVNIFHAGTALKDGEIVSIGGRVLGITASGSTVTEAREKAYAAVDALDWPEGFCRRDIAWRALSSDAAK